MLPKKRNAVLFIAVFAAAAVLLRPEWMSTVFSKLCGAFSPILIGIITAAVLDPAVCRISSLLRRICVRISGRTARYISIALIYIVIIGAAAAAVWFIIPQLADSVRLFVSGFDGYYTSLRQRLGEISSGMGGIDLIAAADKCAVYLSGLFPDILGRVYGMTTAFVAAAADIIVGAVLAVYMLAGKQSLLDFIGGIASSIFSERTYSKAAHVLCTVSGCMVSFISGQLTEAVVLGTLCFLGMVLLGFEYPLLISTIIGVTAIVPVVGAFVGAIPSALMLFLVKPSSAMWFVVFIIILQQLENNLIYPKIVGKSVGLPPLLILAAIVIGAQFGGALGIIAGIPLLSAVYSLAAEGIERERRQRIEQNDKGSA